MGFRWYALRMVSMQDFETNGEQWHLVDKDEVARTLKGNFETVETTSILRYDSLLRYRNLYRDNNYRGSRPWDYRSRNDSYENLPENMIRPLVDTLTAKLIRDRPRVTAFTVGGGLEARTRAKKLSLFWDGIWQQSRVHANLGRYVRDGLVSGDGVWHVRKELTKDGKKGKIHIDLVASHELYVDSVEAYYGSPRRMYRRRWFDRSLLQQLFPDFHAEIQEAHSAGNKVNEYTSGPLLDLVEVIEAWALPSCLEAEDGLYTMVIGDACIKYEPWEYPDFPFICFQPTPPMTNDGFWGTGIVEVLQQHQVQLSQTAAVVNRSQEVLGRPWVMVEQNSEVNVEHLTNEEGIILKYKGQQPNVYTPDPVSQQMYMDVDNRRRKMIEDSGVSRMSLTSQKPVGFDPSGKAIQEMSDVESERFMEMGRSLQESMVQLAKWTVRIARELDNDIPGGFKIVARDGREALELNWQEVDIDDDAFLMHSETTSWHGRSFSGRIADVERLANLGAIQDPAQMGVLLGMPDVESYLAEKASPTQVVEMMAEVMLTVGKFVPPEPYMPLEQSVMQMQLIYLREVTKRKGANDERLELLRRWMDQATTMLTPTAPSVAQQAADASVVSADNVVAPGTPGVGPVPGGGAPGGGAPPVV